MKKRILALILAAGMIIRVAGHLRKARRRATELQRLSDSKEQIIEGSSAPYIVARGRKGGSNVAAAICNALLYQITR